jgi:hypothetical protein
MNIEWLMYIIGTAALLAVLRWLIAGKKEFSHEERMLASWDRIGEKLREENFMVWPFLNHEKKHIEFRESRGALFARASVGGGEGYPLFATVVSPQPLPRIARLAFEQELSALAAVDFKTGV